MNSKAVGFPHNECLFSFFWLPFLTQLILIYIICLVFSSFPMCSTTDAAWICIRTLTWPPTLPRPLPTTPCRSPTPPWPSHSTNWWKPALSPSASAQPLLLPLPLLSTKLPSLIYKLPSQIANRLLQNYEHRHTTAIRKLKEISSPLTREQKKNSLIIFFELQLWWWNIIMVEPYLHCRCYQPKNQIFLICFQILELLNSHLKAADCGCRNNERNKFIIKYGSSGVYYLGLLRTSIISIRKTWLKSLSLLYSRDISSLTRQFRGWIKRLLAERKIVASQKSMWRCILCI